MPKLIPLYDETADIACTITEAEIPGRLALIDDLRAAMTGLDRTDHGMLLHFRPDAEIEAKVRQFTLDEKRCCEFWGFGVSIDHAELTLQWNAPPTAMGLVDRLEAFFTGDEPASALSGLL